MTLHVWVHESWEHVVSYIAKETQAYRTHSIGIENTGRLPLASKIERKTVVEKRILKVVKECVYKRKSR